MESVKIPFNVKVHEILERFEGAKSVGEKLEIYSQLKGEVAALNQVLKLMRLDWATPSVIAPQPPQPGASGTLIRLLATAPRHEFEEATKLLASVPVEKPLIQFIESQEKKKASKPLSEVAPVSSEVTPVSSEVAPVSSEVTPVSSEVAPVSSEVAPVSSEVAPVSSEVAPVSSEVAPVSSEVAPVSSEVAPVSSGAVRSCVACEGSGKSSSGKECKACSGSGQKKEEEASAPPPKEKGKRGRPRKEVKALVVSSEAPSEAPSEAASEVLSEAPSEAPSEVPSEAAPDVLPATHFTPEVVFVQDPLDDVSLIEKHRHGIDFLDMIGTWDKIALMTAYKKHVGKAATADMSMSLLAASILEAKEKVKRITSVPERVTHVTSVPERVTSVPERVTSVPESVTSVPESVTSVPESVTEPSTIDPVDLPTDPPKKQPTRRRIGKLNGKKESAPKVTRDSETEPEADKEADKEAVKTIAILDSAAAVAPKRVPNLLDQVALNQKATAMVDELFKGMQLEVDEDMFRREMMTEMTSWEQERVVKEWEKSTGAKFTPAVTRNQMLLEIVETLAK
jgi:hypothetical protein